MNSEVFIEQAEYLSFNSFNEWSANMQNESAIIKKLSQSGAKLITGPRGCGKTTLLLKVYNKLIRDAKSTTLPVYVNFKSSLKLEPLYKNTINATYWFNQWIQCKVLYGLYEAIKEFDKKLISDTKSENILQILNNLENGKVTDLEDKEISIQKVIDEINNQISIINKLKCVLLLDDAGHAFSSEQQHDFFEFFREIKTKTISPKAAVYPGVTSYSSAFHIGHDAEEIDVWIKPGSTGYLDFMHSLLKSRFGNETYNKLNSNKYLLNLMCYASYGIPRSLLNMISEFASSDNDDENEINIKLTNKDVLSAIKNNFDKTFNIYDSLRLKLPMYANFVSNGSKIYESFIGILKEFNKNSSIHKQSSIIALQRPLSSDLTKVIGFFQYAGLVSNVGISSRGNKGIYELYELHYSAIVERNIFFSSRGINIENYCTSFEFRPNHYYPRHSEKSILNHIKDNLDFSLSLPECSSCKTPRISEESKFCSNCGAKLKSLSIFESIVQQEIENLPITKNRANSIKSNSEIKTIKDILMDTDNKKLFSVHMIGKFWAKKIKNYAEEFIA
jgi:energy-coupling factor transporter ATP-binding protein EcfA2